VLCEDVLDDAAALEVARRLATALTKPMTLAGREVYVTASLGVSSSGHPGDSTSSLLRDADTAMYSAKERGRDRIELFDPESHEMALDRMRLGNELHTALARGELRVYYQPIVDLQTKRLSGLEALVRWEHPDRGLLHPGEFIAMAEESGLIVPIGAWVLEESCRQFVSWDTERVQRAAAPPSIGISVNLSPRQLTEPDLVDQVAGVLERTGIDPQLVWLEITEGALQGDAHSTIHVLSALRAIGVHLSIDDFGSGYSSLGHLSRFPVEALKIDRSFVEGLGRAGNDATIVASVVTLARSLGLIAIAEGAERPEQLSELRSLGCDYVQGFLLGVPLPADVIGAALTDDLTPWTVDPTRLIRGLPSPTRS
jgi:EAL domain-containing protein (putative c-di-GMP-specific phosphodiesterase class I)